MHAIHDIDGQSRVVYASVTLCDVQKSRQSVVIFILSLEKFSPGAVSRLGDDRTHKLHSLVTPFHAERQFYSKLSLMRHHQPLVW